MKQKFKMLNKYSIVEKVCPEHGKLGFSPTETKCICGKELETLRTVEMRGVLAKFHRKDRNKNKNKDCMEWTVKTGIPDETAILDEIITAISLGRSAVSVKIEMLEEK